MSVLAPRLTALDRRVLDSLPAADEPGERAADVANAAFGSPYWHCDDCGREVPRWSGKQRKVCRGCWDREIAAHAGIGVDVASMARSLRPVKRATATELRECAEILRGLEACGYAVCRNGWWRRA